MSDELPRKIEPVPNPMLAGISAFYRLGPLPPFEADLVTILGESEPLHGWLLLDDGCFRFANAHGQVAVFSFDTVLGLVERRLVVGPLVFRLTEARGWGRRSLGRACINGIYEEAQQAIRRRCGAARVWRGAG